MGTRQEMNQLKAGLGAAMLVDPVGNRAFIACTPDNKIVIFDFNTLTVSGKLDVGG